MFFKVLKRFGVPSRCLGFIGGFTGHFIKSALDKEEILSDFVWLDEDTRINVKLNSDAETEINGRSPKITDRQLAALFTKLKAPASGDFLVLSGSVPSALPADIYREMIMKVSEKGAYAIVDTSGQAFKEAMKAKPFLVKPNHLELGGYFGVDVQTIDDVKNYGRKLVNEGAGHVIISMGSKGAVYIDEKTTLYASAPKGRLKNSVGAGDSVVGGFLADYARNGDLYQAFKNGAACGSATAFSLDLCTAEEAAALLPHIQLSKI
ncbi:1-phosphofructokinase family hexose kinase [Terrilactibacillus sp. S3-3]|nr:1-phosphofructokinase family hexose kinase [Terrilactibacillus sp. S3-3]